MGDKQRFWRFWSHCSLFGRCCTYTHTHQRWRLVHKQGTTSENKHQGGCQLKQSIHTCVSASPLGVTLLHLEVVCHRRRRQVNTPTPTHTSKRTRQAFLSTLVSKWISHLLFHESFTLSVSAFHQHYSITVAMLSHRAPHVYPQKPWCDARDHKSVFANKEILWWKPKQQSDVIMSRVSAAVTWCNVMYQWGTVSTSHPQENNTLHNKSTYNQTSNESSGRLRL